MMTQSDLLIEFSSTYVAVHKWILIEEILIMFSIPGMLFHRVILMSGSALSSWARASSPHNTVS